MIIKTFRFGPVSSIRLLPEKFCAFVNFKSKEGAGKAMCMLQVSVLVICFIFGCPYYICKHVG